MKHLKIYEENENIKSLSKVLAEKLSEKFFADVDEFDRIIVQKSDTGVFEFFICFNEVFKETIQLLEKFWKFICNNKNGWSLQTNIFTYDDIPKIFDFVHLNEKTIIQLLEKLQLEEDVKKYNI